MSTMPDGPAAARAVNGYFQALTSQDAQGAYDSSDDGPLAVAGIILDTATVDADRGATTTMTMGSSSLTPASESAGKVVFEGSLTITTTISGSQGTSTDSDSVSGPLTVSDESGTWRVTDFTYDGRPVDFWNIGASRSVDGLTVSLGYIVSYGDLTAALVAMRQDSGSADVQLESLTMTAGGDSEQGRGDFTGPPAPSGVLRFSRVDATPSDLALDFSSSSGPSYHFDFSFS